MMRAVTPRQPRPRTLRWAARFVIVLALPCGLAGCLVHLPASTPVATVGVATVPAAFFAATPAIAPPPDPPAGRYTLGAVTALAANDPRAAYAVPVLGQNGRFVQVALRIDELQEPQPPAVAYELVGEDGVYAALADGEWERASAKGALYTQEGVLLFVVPRDLQKARLEIVDYFYPRPTTANGPTPPAVPPLVRRVLASFALDRLP
ncbi:MAG TPA: hypothetical protein VIL85_15910 [Thermomicrobiales bacterium]|jgi:hypothetical protein